MVLFVRPKKSMDTLPIEVLINVKARLKAADDMRLCLASQRQYRLGPHPHVALRFLHHLATDTRYERRAAPPDSPDFAPRTLRPKRDAAARPITDFLAFSRLCGACFMLPAGVRQVFALVALEAASDARAQPFAVGARRRLGRSEQLVVVRTRSDNASTDGADTDADSNSAMLHVQTTPRARWDRVLAAGASPILRLDAAWFVTNLGAAVCDIVAASVEPALRADARAGGKRVAAELRSMDVHRVGGGEKPHRERSSLFGTLVVCLPLEHTGGDLIVRHKGVVVVFDWANRIEQDLLLQKQMQKQQAISGSIDDLCPPAIHWAAFNSACEHEILPVQSGLRVTVTYNLLLVDTGTSDVICPPVDAISLGPFHALLAALLKDPVFMPRGGTLGFGLQHQYPMGLNIPETVFLLKGVDLLVYKGATALGIRVRMMAAYAPQHDSGSDFDRRDNYDVLMDQKSGKKYRSLDVFKQYRRSFGHTSYGVYVGEKFSERWWDEEYDGAILTEGLGAVHDRSIKWVHYPTSDYGKTYLAYVSGGSELEYDVSGCMLLDIPSFVERKSSH